MLYSALDLAEDVSRFLVETGNLNQFLDWGERTGYNRNELEEAVEKVKKGVAIKTKNFK